MSRRKGNGNQNNMPLVQFSNQDIEAFTKWLDALVKKYRGEVREIKTEWVVFKDENGAAITLRPEATLYFYSMEDTITHLQSEHEGISFPVEKMNECVTVDSTTL